MPDTKEEEEEEEEEEAEAEEVEEAEQAEEEEEREIYSKEEALIRILMDTVEGPRAPAVKGQRAQRD